MMSEITDPPPAGAGCSNGRRNGAVMRALLRKSEADLNVMVTLQHESFEATLMPQDPLQTPRDDIA